MRPRLVRAYQVLIRAVELAVIALTVGLAAIVPTGVFFRYVLNASLGFTDELGGILLVWITFLGAVVALDRRSHLDMDPFGRRVPPRGRIALRAFADIGLAVLLIVLVINGWTITTRLLSATMISLPIPRGVVQAVMPISGALMLAVLAARWLLPEATGEHHRHALGSTTPALAGREAGSLE